MRIREYTPADFEMLRRMHAAQGFGYPLPDLESPLFISKIVLEADDENEGVESAAERELTHRNSPRAGNSEFAAGELPNAKSPLARSQISSPRIAMAILQRLTAETYLLHDPTAGTPRLHWQQFLALHEAARRDAAAHGLDDVQAFLPPPVARAFGRRLQRLGWNRDPWNCYTLRVG